MLIPFWLAAVQPGMEMVKQTSAHEKHSPEAIGTEQYQTPLYLKK